MSLGVVTDNILLVKFRMQTYRKVSSVVKQHILKQLNTIIQFTLLTDNR